jgi:ribosome-associated protein
MELISQHGAAASRKAALKLVADGGDLAPSARDEGKTDAFGLALLAAEERSREILSLILKELDDDKAEAVVTIPLVGKTDIADAMVIATGRSQRHVGATADKVVRRLKENGFGRTRMEGQPACDWVLIDAEDVIVHIFRPEVRAFYNLERIWSSAARGSHA